MQHEQKQPTYSQLARLCSNASNLANCQRAEQNRIECGDRHADGRTNFELPAVRGKSQPIKIDSNAEDSSIQLCWLLVVVHCSCHTVPWIAMMRLDTMMALIPRSSSKHTDSYWDLLQLQLLILLLLRQNCSAAIKLSFHSDIWGSDVLSLITAVVAAVF